MILIDTNICIAYLNGTDTNVRERLTARSPSEVALCSVVKGELLFGARKSQQVDRNLGRLAIFFANLPSLPFDDLAAGHYGDIRAQLEMGGTPIGANDLMIAAIARAHDATLVTRNDREFRRVVGLRIDVW